MKFSIFQLPTSFDARDDGAVLDAVIEQALYADRTGWNAVFQAEHHTSGLSPQGADSMMFAAHLAGRFKQAWIGFALLVVPYEHPVRLVERMNLLDRLTEGRCLFGVGSGNRDIQECVSLGIEMGDAASYMLEEHMTIAAALWEREPASEAPYVFDTKYFKGTIVDRVVPSPFTKPTPKIMGVAMRDASIERSAKNGWPVFVFGSGPDANRRLRLYREQLAAADHSPEVLQHCMEWTTHTVIHAVVADTDAEARAILVKHLKSDEARRGRQGVFQGRARAWLGVETPPRPSFGDLTDPDRPDYMWGGPDRIAQLVQERVDLGYGNVMLCFDGDVYSPERREDTERSMALFSEEVMPRFKDVKTPGHPLAIPLDDLSPATAADAAPIKLYS